ncbi:hypothetical protein QBC43DRAFT_348336 [Cladorrhinum sp. PSN259]|nr:hypothetical protein QBC43DRAFT_348336 [Cladorrhinum sp. PSN259]
MAPSRNERPSQRARNTVRQRARGGRTSGVSEPRGGRGGRGGSSSRGRAILVAASDSGGPSNASRRYNTGKTAPPGTIAAQTPAWQFGEGPQKADQALLRVLETGVHADALVICGERQWNVHKMSLLGRSTWFAEEIEKIETNGKPEFNLTGSYTIEEVNTILHTIYGNRLPERFYDHDDKSNSLQVYVSLFNMGVLFGIHPMRDDALTLVGRRCDRLLERICSFDPDLSDVRGVLPKDLQRHLFQESSAGADLCLALNEAFLKLDTYTDQTAQCLLANYIHAGRSILLEDANLRQIINGTPLIAAALWYASQGRNLANWLPDSRVISERHNNFDHSKKTQHPERCELCDETFDGRNRKRVMYDPHKILMRPAGYCLACVEKSKGESRSIFRKRGKTDREGIPKGFVDVCGISDMRDQTVAMALIKLTAVALLPAALSPIETLA